MLQACLLAVIAGYADTIGYLRYEAFAGLMTGNTIFLGIEIATAKWAAAAFHGAIILVFLLGVIVARVVLRLGWPVWLALSLTAALLALCGLLGQANGALVLAFAMGIQNSAANRFNGVALNTVFITGNLQKLGEGLFVWLWSRLRGEAQPERSDGVAIFALVWLGYAIGAAVGAFGHARLGYPLIVPALMLPFVMMRPEEFAAIKAKAQQILNRGST